MDQVKIEKYKGSQETLVSILPFLLIGILAVLWDQGFNDHVLQGFGLMLLGLVFLWLSSSLTFIKIIDKTKLVSKVGFGKGFNADISDISEIDRTSVFIFKHWGSRLHFHFTDKNGKESVAVVQESMYNVKTIKQLLKRLKELNPSIRLNKQYQDLVDGKIDDNKGFKKLPILN